MKCHLRPTCCPRLLGCSCPVPNGCYCCPLPRQQLLPHHQRLAAAASTCSAQQQTQTCENYRPHHHSNRRTGFRRWNRAVHYKTQRYDRYESKAMKQQCAEQFAALRLIFAGADTARGAPLGSERQYNTAGVHSRRRWHNACNVCLTSLLLSTSCNANTAASQQV
jgi:hypothetical protein